MDTRRQILLNKLEEAAASAAPERLAPDCKAICFQVLYGLRWELQIGAACSMLQRYLPIFEKKQPGVSWPRRLLEDVVGWARTEGTILDPPDGADSADLRYALSFATLLTALSFKDEPVCLAADACGTVDTAAFVRARNVWLADDPDAARIEREEDAYYAIEEELRPGEPPPSFRELESLAHSPYHNVAFIAVYRREWRAVAAWLRTEAVWQSPEPEDLDAMMEGLKRWQSIELMPAGPTLAGLDYPLA